MTQREGGVLKAQQRRVNSLKSARVFSSLERMFRPTRGNPFCAESEKPSSFFDVSRGHSWRILSTIMPIAAATFTGLTPSVPAAQVGEVQTEVEAERQTESQGNAERGVPDEIIEHRSVETMTVLGPHDEMQTIPGSGQYLDQEDIRTQGYDDALRLVSQIPGVYVRQEDGNGLFPNISLRGVDSTRSAKVTVMEDGILAAPAAYSAPAAYYSPAAGRMQGIEVLKGSSQVRYGPHTTGGVLNYLSTAVPDDLAVYGKLMYGGNNETRLHAYGGDSFETDSLGRLGALVEAYFWQSDGFRRIDESPDFQNGDRTGFSTIEPMVKLFWEPSSKRYQRFDFKFGYTDSNAFETYLGTSEADFDANPLRRYTATRFDEITREHFRFNGNHVIEMPSLSEGGEASELTTRAYYSEFSRNWRKLQDLEAIDTDGDGIPEMDQTAKLSRALALDGARDPSTNLLTPGTEGMPLEVLRGERAGVLSLRNNNRTYEQWGIEQTAELPFGVGALDHTLSVGWRFHQDDVRRFQTDEVLTFAADGTLADYSPGSPGDGGNRYQRTRALAVHFEDVIEVGDFTIRPGIRYERLWQRAINYQSNASNIVTASGSNKMDQLGGGIGATWAPADTLTLFAGVYSGFSPPNPRSAIFQGINEERSIASELGGRYEMPNWGLSAEVTGFFTRFNDLLVIDNVGGAGTGNAENVGEVNSGGVEMRLALDPAQAFEWGTFRIPLSVRYTYTNARLRGDASSADAESLFSGGKNGNRVPYIPDHLLAASAGVEWWRVGVNASLTYQTSVYTTASNTTALVTPEGIPDSRFGKLPANMILDLVAWVYADTDERIKIMVGAQNVTDSQTEVIRHPTGPRVNKPRWVYGGVELSF